MKLHRLITLTAAALFCATGALTTAHAQTNTQLRSRLALGGGNGEVAASGNYAYVARDSAGLAIIDTTNPAAPVLCNTILPFAHAHISDVQVVGNLAYLSNEVPNGSPTPFVGMFIYDISNPLAPVEVSRLEWGMGGGYHLGCDAHSITVDVQPGSRTAYLSSGITGDVAVFDVTNPAAPVYLTEIQSPIWSYNAQAHDVLIRDHRAYITWLGGGFTIHDVTNPAAPVQIGHKPTVGVNSEFFYHMALSTDGQTLITTGEVAGGAADPVRLWNVSNPGAITLTSNVFSPGGAVPHQVTIAGKYAYIAWFTDGLRVIDIGNPAAPRLVANYDPEPGSGTSFVGGISVAVLGEKVYLSHTTGGLYTLDFVDTITITRADWKRHTDTLIIEATSSAGPSPTLTLAGYGTMTYSTTLGRYTISVPGVTAKPNTVTVTSDIGATRTGTVRKVN